MAKKREWKAWMVVNKRGEAMCVPFFGYRFAKDLLRVGERIIRVRIQEIP